LFDQQEDKLIKGGLKRKGLLTFWEWLYSLWTRD
jgi:hypothetical protein